MDRKLIFYDFEVFRENWLVVFIDYDTKKECVIVDDRDRLIKFYNTFKDCVFVGYNNRSYDDTIFKGILMGKNPFKLTDELINQGKKQYQVLPKEHNKIQLYSYDTSTGFHSLKQLEAFIGINIEETSVPFDINRKLTEDEVRETIKYCRHDVLSTIMVFEEKKADFDAHVGLIEMFDLDIKYLSKTKAQLSAVILGAEKPSEPRNDEWDIVLPDNLIINKYKEVVEWFEGEEFSQPKAKLTVDIYGVPHEFAQGGLHGATKKKIYDGVIGCWDVSSYYPATIINYDLISRNVKDRNKYKEIRDLRIKYKAEKNPLQASLKLLINSTYGILNDKYNPMYDPHQAHSICVYCQLFLLDLIEKIEKTCGEHAELIQSNTDGVYFRFESEEWLEKAQHCVTEWEQRTGYIMELDKAKKIIQRDVNNYILITEKGKVKSKGAVVKSLSKIDYDLPVVNKAMKAYLVDGIRFEDYIANENRLIEYQKVYKLTSNYRCVVHNNQEYINKVYRVFASTREEDTPFFKFKKDKSSPDRFASTPEHTFIDNSDITDKLVPACLDKNWYLERCKSEYKKFTGKDYKGE